jgi:hypothetical protein
MPLDWRSCNHLKNPVTKGEFSGAENKQSLREERKRTPPDFVSVKSSRSLVDAKTPGGETNNHHPTLADLGLAQQECAGSDDVTARYQRLVVLA